MSARLHYLEHELERVRAMRDQADAQCQELGELINRYEETMMNLYEQELIDIKWRRMYWPQHEPK